MSVEDLEQSLEVRRKDTPHLWNLNEDPALSDVIVHFVDKGEQRGREGERGCVGRDKQTATSSGDVKVGQCPAGG